MNNNPRASLPFAISSDPEDTLSFERTLQKGGYANVAGVDEAGRGPLAGPVVAGCVVLPAACDYRIFKDSKKLTEKDRESAFAYLREVGADHFGIGVVDAPEIDRFNILQASLLAMKLAIEDLSSRNPTLKPDFLLVDGKFPVPLTLDQQPLIKGESKSASIAAASIVAKVTRDRLMERYDAQYPCYGFLKHKGYPTKAHRQALKEHGPCTIHRKTFKGVREYHLPDEEIEPASQSLLW